MWETESIWGIRGPHWTSSAVSYFDVETKIATATFIETLARASRICCYDLYDDLSQIVGKCNTVPNIIFASEN